jgi:hypothetical protein
VEVIRSAHPDSRTSVFAPTARRGARRASTMGAATVGAVLVAQASRSCANTPVKAVKRARSRTATRARDSYAALQTTPPSVTAKWRGILAADKQAAIAGAARFHVPPPLIVRRGGAISASLATPTIARLGSVSRDKRRPVSMSSRVGDRRGAVSLEARSPAFAQTACRNGMRTLCIRLPRSLPSCVRRHSAESCTQERHAQYHLGFGWPGEPWRLMLWRC